MQYRIRGNEVIQTTETNGTIQNISDAEAEISTSADFTDSFVLRGWDRITFTSPLYIRAREKNSSLIVLNVLQNFFLSKGGGGLSTEDKEAISQSFKAAKTEGNTVSFFTGSDTTGTAAFAFNFPEEVFLNQLGTEIVDNFSWSALAYPNSANPNLEGKTVFVLAVKGDKTTNPTIKYSFVNMEKLVDIYTASDTSITISDYKVAVNISAAANNAITKKNDGLHVDISGKVDKVKNATAGNIPFLASDGGLVDSGHNISKILNPVRYGIRIKKTEPEPYTRVEYIYDAVGFTPAKMIFDSGGASNFEYGSWADVWFIKDNKPLMLKSDGTVDYYLYENDYSIKANGDDVTTPSTAADSDSDVANTDYDGNAMAQFPLVWIKRYEDADYIYEIVSNVKYDDEYYAYAHTNADGDIKDYFYLSLFRSSGDASKARSLSGQTVFKNTAPALNTAVTANGPNWRLASYCQKEVIRTLCVLISKSTDSLTAFGTSGYYSTDSVVFSTTGVHSTTGQFSGIPSTNQAAAEISYTTGPEGLLKVFHTEGFISDGGYIAGLSAASKSAVYVKPTPEGGEYTFSNLADMTLVQGAVLPTNWRAWNWIINIKMYSWGFLLTTYGGSQSTYYASQALTSVQASPSSPAIFANNGPGMFHSYFYDNSYKRSCFMAYV